MWNVIYTKSLDSANELVAKSWYFEDEANAIALFNEKIERLMRKILNNKYLNCKISIHSNKALVKIEDAHYVIAVTNDDEMLRNDDEV